MRSARNGTSAPRRPPVAVLLGINEIASAVGLSLFRAGYGVVHCHDPLLPVVRRGMAFHDALYGEPAVVAGIPASPAETTRDVRQMLAAHAAVCVTRLELMELLVIGPFDVLVDARMHKRSIKPDLRHLARVTVGLGPGFTVGSNCDVAVETKPEHAGEIITAGATTRADGHSRSLENLGKERFVYSVEAGRWHTALEIGKRVFKGFQLGRVRNQLVLAPMDGNLRGIVRDGVDVPAGVKLIEIDPRGRRANWTGTDDRGRAIAEATLKSLSLVHQPESRMTYLPTK